MAQPTVPDWDPSFGIDPRNLQLCHTTTNQLHRVESASERLPRSLHQSFRHLPGVDPLSSEGSQAALAGPDTAMRDQAISFSDHELTPRPLYDVNFPELGDSACLFETYDMNSEPGVVQYPTAYTDTEQHSSQPNSHQHDPFMQLTPGNEFEPEGPNVPNHSFMGMEPTAKNWHWGSMTGSMSTQNDFLSTQAAGITIPVSPQNRASGKHAPKLGAFRPYKARNRRSQRLPTPDLGSSLSKRGGSRVGRPATRISSHRRNVERDSVETGVSKLHHNEQQQALAVLKKFFRPSSALTAQRFTDLMAQMEQLVLENQEYAESTTIASAISLTSTVSTIDSLSNSGIVDSEYSSDDTSVSSTPGPQVHDLQECTPSRGQVERKHRHCAKCGVKPLFCCTRKKCGYTTHTFTDWKRHEEGEKHWPQERFMCLECPSIPAPTDMNIQSSCEFCHRPFGLGEVPRAHYLMCISARRDCTTFSRKDHLIQHLRDEHGLTYTYVYISTWRYSIDSRWPKQCGFCDTQFTTWEQRMRHIAVHFEEGKDMCDWKWPPARPKDPHPRLPHNWPQNDDSDSDDDFDDSNGGAGRSGTAGMRNAMSSTHQPQGCAQHGGTQYTSFTSRGHSSQFQGTENSSILQDPDGCLEKSIEISLFKYLGTYRPAKITNKRDKIYAILGLRPPSVALEMYLNDPYEPIGALMGPFRSQISGQLPSVSLLDNDDWAKDLRAEPGHAQQTEPRNESFHSKPRGTSVEERAPCPDSNSTITALEECTLDLSTLENDDFKTNPPLLHGPISSMRMFSCSFAFAGCSAKFSSKKEWTRHVSSQHLSNLLGQNNQCQKLSLQRMNVFTALLRIKFCSSPWPKSEQLLQNLKVYDGDSLWATREHAIVQMIHCHARDYLLCHNTSSNTGQPSRRLFQELASGVLSLPSRPFDCYQRRWFRWNDRTASKLDCLFSSFSEGLSSPAQIKPLRSTANISDYISSLLRLASLLQTIRPMLQAVCLNASEMHWDVKPQNILWNADAPNKASASLRIKDLDEIYFPMQRTVKSEPYLSEGNHVVQISQRSRFDVPSMEVPQYQAKELAASRRVPRQGPWSRAEDTYLIQLVQGHGSLNWVRIASLMGSRSPKQCRERYHQNLKSSMNHEPINPAEGVQFERMIGQIGKRWTGIACRLHGRSDNAVKDRWNGSMVRRRRLRRTSTQHPKVFDQPSQSYFATTSLSRLRSIDRKRPVEDDETGSNGPQDLLKHRKQHLGQLERESILQGLINTNYRKKCRAWHHLQRTVHQVGSLACQDEPHNRTRPTLDEGKRSIDR